MPYAPAPKIREICLLCLYAKHVHADQDGLFCKILASELKVSSTWIAAGWQRANTFTPKLAQVDKLIDETILGYQPERLGSLERAVLRLGICEMLFDESISPSVAISEAMRLVNKFSDRKSATLINAVMDEIFKKKSDDRAST